MRFDPAGAVIRLSSSSTFMLRGGFGALLAALVVYGLADAEIGFGWGYGAFFLVFAAHLTWSNRNLWHVRIHGGALRVSRNWRAFEIPLCQIADVWQDRDGVGRLVTVELHAGVPGVGRAILFLPRRGWMEPGWRVDRVVGALRRHAGLALEGPVP